MSDRMTNLPGSLKLPGRSDRLSLPELEAYLWGAATILRGLVDAGDYKQYVFPLLFYKRLTPFFCANRRQI